MIIETTAADQILNVEGSLDVDRGPFTYKADKTALTIVKLPDDGDYIRLDDSGSDNFNPGAATAMGWDIEDEIDATGFTHTDSKVFAAADDDYLFLTALYENEDAGARTEYWQRWEINDDGADIPQYGHSGGFGRDTGGADTVGNWSGFLQDLTIGDSVEVISQALGNAGTLSANIKGLQAVRIGSLLTQAAGLTWDGTIDNAWMSAHWTPGPVEPAGGEDHTVGGGKVLVQSDVVGPLEAFKLTIAGGEVEIQPAGRLDVTSKVDVPGLGAVLDIDGELNAAVVDVGTAAILELNGKLSAGGVTLSGTNTAGAGADLVATVALNLNSNLDISAGTLTTTGADVVATNSIVTINNAISAANLTLHNSMVVTNGSDLTVESGGGTALNGRRTRSGHGRRDAHCNRSDGGPPERHADD